MGHSRVRAEVSRRNAPAGRRLYHSSPAPPSVLPAAPPGDCRGLSPRPAAPELTRHLPTLAAAHNTILCWLRGAGHCTQTLVFPKALLVHVLCRRGSERVNGMTLRSLSRAPLPRPLRRCRCATCQHRFPYLRCVYFRRGRSYTQLPTNPTRVVQRLFAWVHVCNLCADRDVKTDSSTQKVPSCQSPHLPWKVTSVQTPVSTD